jgi:nucleotide-binding universal stress UspA family protein
LVAIDHSQSADRIAEFVSDFFGPLDVEIIAISVGVVQTPVLPLGIAPGEMAPWASAAGAQLLEDGVEAQTKQALANAEHSLADCHLKDDEEIVEVGNPADVILQAADERNVDLIVVGASSRKVFKELLSPSVPARLAKGAHVPVLLVP